MEIDLKDWTLSGEGGTAQSYYHNDDSSVMLKLFTGASTGPEYAKQEFTFAKNVEKCGIRIAKAVEIVECGDRTGIVYERIVGKKSFSRLCADYPDDIEKYAKEFARECKALHQTKCTVPEIVSREDQLRRISEDENGYSEAIRNKIKEFIKKYPETNTCLHGDMQSGNLIRAGGNNYWIDLGAFAYGNPMYDLACMYFFYNMLPGELYATTILHMNVKQLKRFWKAFIDEYLIELSEEDKSAYIQEIKNSVFIFLIYTADYEDHEGVEGFALKYGLDIVARLAKL